ncbi:MAG: hypothetical protein HGGPFJEG_00833 [Ignavibacteria bacterium]|nr:hypothetical protein [Ignavibacteria bacterium]
MQRRILLVRTDRVGDVVMITPLIRELQKTFPEAFIGTLTNENSVDVLLHNPNIDVIISDDLKKDTFWSTVKKIRSYKFTDGLLIMPTERAAYQMFFAGIKNRIGVGRKIYEVVTFMKSVSRNKYIPLRHEADYCMDMGRKLGVRSDNLTPEIYLNDAEKFNGEKILVSEGVNISDKKIIVHTGSGKSSRNWSEEKYLGLLKKILEIKNNAVIILTAKEMSSEFKEEACKLDNKRIFFTDDKIKRLRDLICIIANTDMMIASSTGPLHLASALNKKTIGLYCHRRMNCAAHWGALGEKSVNLEVSKEYCDANCSPDKEVCNFENGISIDEVIKHINNDL